MYALKFLDNTGPGQHRPTLDENLEAVLKQHDSLFHELLDHLGDIHQQCVG
jgi:hypothetical protein